MPLIETKNNFRVILPGSEAFATGWVCGAIYMIRTDLARKLGGFDPRFFLYWEEMDLCHRAADMGFETWAYGGAVANHICGASSNDDDTRIAGCIGKYFYQSRRYYMIKHHGWWAATLSELGEFATLCLRTVVDMLRGKGVSRIRPRLQTPLFSMPAKWVAHDSTGT
jgi:GT2 family glycosyltransferase